MLFYQDCSVRSCLVRNDVAGKRNKNIEDAKRGHPNALYCFCSGILCYLQGYGLTETCASAAVSTMDDNSTGRVGPPLEGVKLKLINWEEGNYKVTDKPLPRGEIHVGE
jgi:acyl-CoA synthetase (AMP-forming)/AMP-acid ligase II